MSSDYFTRIFDRLRQWLLRLFGRGQQQSAQKLDHTDLLINVFLTLRRSGFVLGIGELHAVLRLAAEQWDGADQDELKQLTQLVWCHSLLEEQTFADVWDAVFIVAAQENTAADPRSKPHRTPPPRPQPVEENTPSDMPTAKEPPPTLTEQPARWEPLPFQVPFTPTPIDDRFELGSYWPISRRQMVYAWRYLRRPLADGPQDVLDIEATVAQTTQRGLFLGAAYRRRECNHARLLLLIDQNGSMVPFHRFTRDLVETARHESTIAQENVQVYYFHNVLAESVYTDPHMTQPVELEHVLAQHCSTDTSLLLASDAGAARGYRRLERIRATSAFLRKLERHTPLIAWLNPMPAERWSGSSAQVIANLLHGHMFQMDPDGFSKAIDVVRGQSLNHE
jgi:hypothetical protein